MEFLECLSSPSMASLAYDDSLATLPIMCKHQPKAQVAIRAPCCRKWFDCPACHGEQEDHDLRKTYEIIFACKKCKKVFKKDMREFEEQDEFCPHCDNHYVLPAGGQGGRLVVSLEGTQNMVRDEREKARHKDTLESMGDGVKESREGSVFHTFDA